MKRTSMYKQYDDNDPTIPYAKCRKCKTKVKTRCFYTCEFCGAKGVTLGGWGVIYLILSYTIIIVGLI